MVLVIDDCIEIDELFGPLPNFNDSFENYFIKKAADLLVYCQSGELKKVNKNSLNKNSEQFSCISLKESKSTSYYEWMYNVPLARNSREQNLEIIYNNKLVYFKALRKISKNESLHAFPSKDLEISLGLQFIPFNGESSYRCRKCCELFNEQFCLMLHSKYFCKNKSIINSNILKRKLNDYNEDQTLNLKMTKLVDASRNEKSVDQEQPLQLTTVTNQLNVQNIGLKPNNKVINPAKLINSQSQSPSSSQNVADFINDQNSSFYAKYFQSLQSLFPTNNNFSLFLQNYDRNVNCLTPLNFTPVYSVPGLMSSMVNSNSSKQQINNPNKPENTTPKQTKSEKSDSKQKAATQNKSPNLISSKKSIQQYDGAQHNVQTGNINSKTQQQQNLEIITAALNFQALQNWCAKCNTQFRLTSDLVYHMRTFHRREGSPTSLNSQTKVAKERDQKHLRCEICNETFKEKHHLTRHMTSHR